MKQRMIAILSEEHGMTKKDAETAANVALQAIKEGLMENGTVALYKIGKLVVKQRDARPGRNPQTGEAMEIPARKALTFTASATIKREINE